MTTPQPITSAEAWLTWFDQHKVAQTRTALCRRYALDAFIADTLINTARFQVWTKWSTLTAPLAFFSQTLRRETWKYLASQQHEQHKLAAHMAYHQRRIQMAERIADRVADLLGGVQSRREHQLLEWFVRGYDDAQVAEALKTTPAAVRVARHSAYRTLRKHVLRRALKSGMH